MSLDELAADVGGMPVFGDLGISLKWMIYNGGIPKMGDP